MSSSPRSPATPNPNSTPRVRLKSRASHTKSRNGCQTCKSRRVKCDEVRPICGACSLRGDRCEFLSRTGHPPRRQAPRKKTPTVKPSRSSHLNKSYQEASIHDDSVQWSTGADEHPVSIPLRPLEFSRTVVSRPTQHHEGLNMLDLRLLQHYILRLSHRMSLNPTKSLVWEKVIPEIAATNEFLMHLVLALAGLDLLSKAQTTKQRACDHPNWPTNPQRWTDSTSNSQSPGEETGPAGFKSSGSSNVVDLETVIEYHQRGLQGFREQLTVLSVANAEAMFAGSLLIVAFAFGSLRIQGLNPPGISEESSGFLLPQQKKPRLDWIYLVRGVTSIVHEHWKFLRMGRLRAIFNFNNARDSWKEIPEDLASTPVPPRCHYSKYLTRFASGAQQALSNLRTFFNTLKLAVAPESPENETVEPDTPMTLGDILRVQSHALEIVEENYMRIMLVLQFANSPQPRTDRMDVQADLEDAMVMAWPQALSYKFVRSMEVEQEDFGVIQHYSFTILAHLHLIIVLLEDAWYAEESFRHEIIKINTLVQSLGDSQLVSLMKWPMEVIS